jgi:hypothetical protein
MNLVDRIIWLVDELHSSVNGNYLGKIFSVFLVNKATNQTNMIKPIVNSLAFILLLLLDAKAQSHSFQSPPSLPELVGMSQINSSLNERDFALTPDGNEIYFTISTPKSTFQTIVFCRKQKNGEWSAPTIASFAGMYSDLEPALSADGNTLYFSSNRPLDGNEVKDFDLWRVRRTANGWGIPEHLGNTINTPADEFYPSITNSGNLYFTAQYKGGVGREDIYVAPSLRLFQVNDSRWAGRAFEAMQKQQFALAICYSSIYGDSWHSTGVTVEPSNCTK